MNVTSVSGSRDETQLVDRFLAGDKDAFAELIRPHVGALYGVALAILKDEHDAEEAVQDAVLKAMTHLAGFRRESKFSTWITQITINEARMKLRKARRHIYRSLDEELTDGESEYRPYDFADWREIPLESLERRELRDALQRALDVLSPTAREVILLRDVQNYSTAETAKILGVSVVAVKSRLLRARMQIRDALAPGIDGAWSLGETKWRKIRPW
jgi:RNA polymerase sigma-70 factor (ECF subfamily)